MDSATQKEVSLHFGRIDDLCCGQRGLNCGKRLFYIFASVCGSSGDKNEVSAQLSGSNSYVVNHTLNKYPSVTVSLGTQATPTEEIECKVTYINTKTKFSWILPTILQELQYLINKTIKKWQ